MCRHGHNGSCAISCEHILAYPHRDAVARERIYGIRARENARNLAVADAFALGTFLYILYVFGHSVALFVGGQFGHELAFWCEHHKRDTENGVGAGCEYGEFLVAVLNAELHLRSFRTAYPVALCLLERVGPVYCVESVEQTLCVCRHTQTPLLHLLLHNGIAAAHRYAVNHLVVGKHRAQSCAPVHHRLAHVSYAIVHQCLLLLLLVHGVPLVGCEAHHLRASHVEPLGSLLAEVLYELFDWLRLLTCVAVERVEHLAESPLSPLVVLRVARADLSAPVERESYVVKLLLVAAYVVVGCLCRMLSGLYGILLGRQSVGVVAHRVEHVVALQTLVACVYVAGNIAERMAHVQTCSRRIWEHVEYIELLFLLVLDNLIGVLFLPPALPFLLYFPEIIFHCGMYCFVFSFYMMVYEPCKDTNFVSNDKHLHAT